MLFLHNSDIVFHIVYSLDQTEKEVTSSYLSQAVLEKLLRKIPHDIIFFSDDILRIDILKRAPFIDTENTWTY